MAIENSAAAAAARAAEARRRDAARKAAELAAKKAADDAAKRAAAQAAKPKVLTTTQKSALAARAGNKPSASAVRQTFGADEISQGFGRALRDRAALKLGSPMPIASAPTPLAKSIAAPAPKPVIADVLAGKKPASTPVSADAAERRAIADRPVTTAPKTDEQRATEDAAQVQRTYDNAIRSGDSDAEAANAASQKLRDLTANQSQAYANHLLRASQPTIDRITDTLAENANKKGSTGDTDKVEVKHAIRALSDVAEKAGPIGAQLIAQPLADKITDGDELMHVDDGFYEHVDNGGSPALMGALAGALDAQGKGDAREELMRRGGKNILDHVTDFAGDAFNTFTDAAGAVINFGADAVNGVVDVVQHGVEMAVDVAQGTVELAGNAAEWTTEQVMNAAEYAAENGLKLAGEALNFVGDHARELAAEALNIDGQLEQLNSVGDSVTIGVGGKIGGAYVQGGAEVQMQITKTEDGYEMTLTGSASGGVFGGLSLPGMPAGVKGEANATGTATATFSFDNLSDVTQAAETVGGIGIGSLVGGPAGALLTGATAGDEIRDIGAAFTGASIGLELSAEAKAEIGGELGIGAEVSGSVTSGVTLQIAPGQPPSLVLNQSVEASGSLSLGAPVDIPSLGGQLNGGSLDGSASISAETTVPLPEGLDLNDLLRDPVGTAQNVGQHVIDNATTKLSLNVDIHGGAATEGLPINLGAEGGIEISLSAEAKLKDLAGALGQAVSGDIPGALETLGTKTELDVEVNTYTVAGLSIDEEISVPGFTIGVKAENTLRDETDVFDFEGTPAELLEQGFNLFQNLNLNVS